MADSSATQSIQLVQQRYKLRAWVRTRLWAQVVIAMLLGFGTGLLLEPEHGWLSPAVAETVAAWLALPGQIFLGLIAMVLVPLIFASIVGGLTGAGAGGTLKRIGLRLAGFILLSTFIAAWLGVALAQWLTPGASFAAAVGPMADAARPDAVPFDPARTPEILAGILPTNPTASIVQGDLLAVVILALLIGIAALQVERDKVAPFLSLMEALLSIAMTVVKWAMFLAPFAVFGLMAQLVMRVGLQTVVSLSTYLGTVLLGLLILLAFYLAVAALRGVGPVAFLRKAGGTLLLAFSTSSSSAIMPMTVGTARQLGVPGSVANLVVPLGATMNMAGTALYQSVAIFFLAQMAGIDLDIGETLVITVTLVASSIGAPGTPGVSIAVLISVATGFGIPTEGMVIVLGVDRLLDMSRTVVNVSGDLVAAVLLRNVLPEEERPVRHATLP